MLMDADTYEKHIRLLDVTVYDSRYPKSGGPVVPRRKGYRTGHRFAASILSV